MTICNFSIGKQLLRLQEPIFLNFFSRMADLFMRLITPPGLNINKTCRVRLLVSCNKIHGLCSNRNDGLIRNKKKIKIKNLVLFCNVKRSHIFKDYKFFFSLRFGSNHISARTSSDTPRRILIF